MQRKILIIEDDNDINKMIQDLLKQQNYEVFSAYSGTEALIYFSNNLFDLILLDYMLPGKSGDEVLNQIRKSSSVPVITITAITDKKNIVKMLKSGANDYITKPFDNDELIARIEVQLRTTQNVENYSKNKKIKFKNLEMDFDKFDGNINSNALHLSKREFEILRILIESPNKVFTKNNLYKSVWKEEFFGDDNTINVHISNIRSKIAKFDSSQKYIQTVWGIGFKMYE
jgi:DNA-binding response OmpR family regulator